MSSSEYIVATALKPRKKIIGQWIEELVQRRSRIESYGNTVFTLMLLQRFESKSEITASFVSQAAIGACMRSVCVRKRNERPSAVEFKYKDVQACMRKGLATGCYPTDEQLRFGQEYTSNHKRRCTAILNHLQEEFFSYAWAHGSTEQFLRIYDVVNISLPQEIIRRCGPSWHVRS